jgi:hypothetical protein
MRRSVRAGVAVIAACVGLVSCSGGRSTVAVPPARIAHDGLTVTLNGAPVTYDADAKVTAARGVLFIRSTSRGAALELASVQHVSRTKNGVSVDVDLRALPVEERFFRKPARSANDCAITTPQSGARRPLGDCSGLPPDADIFDKMEYATGPGDIIPGLARGGGASCPDMFMVGSYWRNVHFDVLTGDGDPNGTCFTAGTGGGNGGLGPTLDGYATDYRYDPAEYSVALDMRLPGDKSSTRSYLLTYRGPGVVWDGALGSFGIGQTSATIIYYLGALGYSGQFSMLQVDMYQGALAPLGPYLGFARGRNPRFAVI